MVAVVVEFTADVLIVNVPVVAPAAMRLVEGTVAEAELDDRATERLAFGAGPLRVIVAVEVDSP